MTIPTRLGAFHAVFSPRGLTGLAWGKSTGRRRERSRWDATLRRQLQAYAAGRAVNWTVPLDLTVGTPFQRAVWRVLRRIPLGETRSYAWVARQIGRPRATRAVGAACGANPIPILVPCHRVVASDGALGGFSAGLRWKKRLLALERVPPWGRAGGAWPATSSSC